jgi:hypothetical protein
LNRDPTELVVDARTTQVAISRRARRVRRIPSSYHLLAVDTVPGPTYRRSAGQDRDERCRPPRVTEMNERAPRNARSGNGIPKTSCLRTWQDTVANRQAAGRPAHRATSRITGPGIRSAGFRGAATRSNGEYYFLIDRRASSPFASSPTRSTVRKPAIDTSPEGRMRRSTRSEVRTGS